MFEACLEEEEKGEKERESRREKKERARMTMILHAGGDFAHNANAYVRNMESENIKINQYDGKNKKNVFTPLLLRQLIMRNIR